MTNVDPLAITSVAILEKYPVIPRMTALERVGITRYQVMPRITITVPDQTPQPYRFQLDRHIVTLGRGSENDIAIDCGSVSVNHAEMRRVEGGYELRDVGSTNGIKLDDERMEVIPLHNGLSVKLGDVAFDFQLTEEEIEALSREKPQEESPIIREPAPQSFPPLSVPPLPERPQPLTTPVRLPPIRHYEDEGMGFGAMLWLLVLALAAFFAGMSLRHRQDTGESLIHSILDKAPAKESPAKP